MDNKRKNGQYFTTKNIFTHPLFLEWIDKTPINSTFIEPFAGSNNIISLMRDVGFNNNWLSFDIEPSKNNICPDINIIQRDMISSYPDNINGVVITNPPYLAKNSAHRRHYNFPDTKYDDLYKLSLDIILSHHDYVCAIIPESFITQNLFHDRLFGIISINQKMFDDTNFPVCLALFERQTDQDFQIFSGEKYLFHYLDGIKIMNRLLSVPDSFLKSNVNNWRFNVPDGELGLFAIDSTSGDSIIFDLGSKIPSESIKVSSRSSTRIANDYVLGSIDIDDIIFESNIILTKLRLKTYDVFFTAFRGLRKDNKYRRRLDFNLSKRILNKAIYNIMNRKQQ